MHRMPLVWMFQIYPTRVYINLFLLSLGGTGSPRPRIRIDNILMLNCLVLSGLIVSEGLRTICRMWQYFFAKFQFQFDRFCSSLS